MYDFLDTSARNVPNDEDLCAAASGTEDSDVSCPAVNTEAFGGSPTKYLTAPRKWKKEELDRLKVTDILMNF